MPAVLQPPGGNPATLPCHQHTWDREVKDSPALTALIFIPFDTMRAHPLLPQREEGVRDDAKKDPLHPMASQAPRPG